MTTAAHAGHSVAPAAGIGLRAPHYREMMARRPSLAFLEIHSENYFGAGGPPHHFLEQLRQDYPLSLHGVGLSLGSGDPLDLAHLAKLKQLAERYQPALVSDHLCWTSIDGTHAHDLLPLPFTRTMAKHVARRIMAAQDTLGRRLLVENASSYVAFAQSDMTEWDFVNEVVAEADCLLLLDINNVYVNAVNHGFEARDYLDAMPAGRVAEIHLAGFDTDARAQCLVDTHGKPVHEPVWALYRETVRRIGPRPTLIEWDADIPPLDVLLDEAT
ncbi:MAG: DUF692 domain-containing protein, partial [Gammaproteobacteria bacterium]|nr:DUF692 domain-containing protein [Gammaproteobacteria bacterium]